MADHINEVAAASDWLYQKLAAAAGVTGIVGGRLYSLVPQPDPAEPDAGRTPYVSWDMYTERDIPVIGADRRAWAIPTFLVVGVYTVPAGGETWEDSDTLAQEIDRALTGQRGPVAGWDATVLGCYRLQHYRQQRWETAEGLLYLRQGGIYRVDTART